MKHYHNVLAAALVALLFSGPVSAGIDIGDIIEILNGSGVQGTGGGSSSPLKRPPTISGTIIFEDDFSSITSNKWQFLGEPWTVVGRSFYPLDLKYGAFSETWVDVPPGKAVDIRVDILVPNNSYDIFSLGITGQQGDEKIRLRGNRRSAGLIWKRQGKTEESELQTRRLDIVEDQIQTIRLLQSNGTFTAQLGETTWTAPFSGFGGRLFLGVLSQDDENDRRFRIKRVAIYDVAGPKRPGPDPGPDSELPTSAPFVVDPRDLDKLAETLKSKADASASVRSLVDSGQVALATFDMSNFNAPSVARDVAEDLSTSLIDHGFSLIERAQLDKVMKELKIQDSGLVDPKTAQQIGKLTGCDLIMVGSISDRGDFVVINSRLLSTSTGKALVAAQQEMRKVRRG